MEFEWDDKKNELNTQKHGVEFDFAAGVFTDYNRLDRLDNRVDYNEIRHQTIGISDGKVLFVVWTERGEKIRIISARFANRKEKGDYSGNS
ncbi:MAG: BrnT family toxin [Proteobacteria bacterium]|nr:BrnT family toxin [Pseudomonadota bacterium]